MVKKVSLFKVLISLMFFVSLPSNAQETYVSIAPNITEIIYALNLEDNLIGVSSKCDYPLEVKQKKKIGSLYGINVEEIIKLKPDYIFALKASEPFVSIFRNKAKIKYFDFHSIKDIENTIIELGDLFDRKNEAQKLVLNIKKSFKKSENPKKIFYVVQTKPLITIGKKSYITDTINHSGNISASKDLEGEYIAVSIEYVVKLKPDYLVLGPYANINDLKMFFPHSKFVVLNGEMNDIINRPSTRIDRAIDFFSSLN